MNDLPQAKITELEAKIKEWVVYANRLEEVLGLVAGSSVDSLKRMQAEKGMRLVAPEQDK